MSTRRENEIVPGEDPTIDGFVSRLYDQIEQLLKGRSRNIQSITLTANSATTVVDIPDFESQQVPVFTPLTANAAAEIPTMYVSARTTGQFTLTHTNNAQTDRDFGVVFTG